MKKIFFDGEYQYDLLVEDHKYTLYYNNSEYWQSDIRNTVAFKVINDGNGYRGTFDKKGRIDYSEAFYLYLILALEKDYKVEIAENLKEI
jgi:hypothetical protein